MSLNLAHDPFVNRRPVRRIGAILWVVGVLLAVANGFLYWNHMSGQGAAESGLEELVGQIEAEATLFEMARTQLASFEPAELNRKVEFVNLRIAQRTFSWSRLFDLVAETLPGDVRLSSLTPRFAGSDRRRRGNNLESGEVLLEIQAEAKTTESLLEFVDRLFAHQAFNSPDLHREQIRRDTGTIDFSVSTVYHVGTPETAIQPDDAIDAVTAPAQRSSTEKVLE